MLPLGACDPVHAPDAAQLVVLMDDHVSVVVAPVVTDVLANFRVGAPGGRVANAASAWINPCPELKSGVLAPIGKALFCNAP